VARFPAGDAGSLLASNSRTVSQAGLRRFSCPECPIRFLLVNLHATSYRPALAVNLLHGAIETDEKMAMDLAGPGYHINRSNLLVLESKADMQKRGQASPNDGDELALTFAQPVAPAEVEEEDEEEAFGRYSGRRSAEWMR
jgi:hypothetical protein